MKSFLSPRAGIFLLLAFTLSLGVWNFSSPPQEPIPSNSDEVVRPIHPPAGEPQVLPNTGTPQSHATAATPQVASAVLDSEIPLEAFLRAPLHRVANTVLPSPNLAHSPLALWPNSSIEGVWQSQYTPRGEFRRSTVLQPSDTPYRVRIDQVMRSTPAGEELLWQNEVVADRFLARLPKDDSNAIHDLLSDHGMTLRHAIGSLGWQRIEIEFNHPQDLETALQVLAELSPEAAAEPDFIVRTLSSPNDPRYLDGSLWALLNTGQSGGTAGADISAPAGWSIRHSAPTVVVGVIDSGIRLTHEDLAANLWINPLEIADGTDTSGNGFIDDIHGINAIQLTGNPSDDQGHGTHVAGTIGAVGNNGVGVTGVAWNVQLMGLKFLAASGGGAISDAILCIDYGVANGAHILNNSWGGGHFSQALLDTIEAVSRAGVIFVAAAGNSSNNSDVEPMYPAALPVNNIVSVASTTRTDALSSFSNFGQGTVDLGAPGSDILSTGFEHDASYVTKSGTSMAAPQVAGALALLRAEYPADTWDQLVHRLYRGVDAIPSLAGGIVGMGGRLNLDGALSAPVNRPANDDFADGRVIHGDRAILRLNLRSATAEPGEPAIAGETTPNTLWFRYTPTASGLTSVTALEGESLFNPMTGRSTIINYDVIPTVFGVFTGSSVDALTEVASGPDSLNFTATAGVTYHIAVAGEGGAEGLVMLDVTGPPSNSTLSNATSLRLNSPTFGTNRNALSEVDEPAHAGHPATASVWYKWTANVTARVAFTTRGSNFDTVAAVYTGPASNPQFSNLSLVGANDNAPASALTFSRIEFQAISGTTYYFAVDGKNGNTGNVTVTLAIPPANDDFENAFVLSGTDVTRGVTTSFASREIGEPIHWPNAGQGETVWYTWTAPESGRTNLDLSGSFFRGIIAVYTGNSLGNLSLVSSDGSGVRFAQLTFEAIQGTTYRIAVDAWDFSLTNAPLRLRMVPTPPNDTFANAAEMQGIRATATGSNVGATREPGETGRDGPSVWHKWTAPASGEYGIYGERLNKAEDRWIIVLNLFTGTAVDALNPIREDQMNGIGRDAFLRFHATAGTTYYIQVTGLTSTGITGGMGPYRLDLRPIAEHAPENNTFASAIELDGSPVFNFRTQNYGASAEPGEPTHSTYEADRTLWWRFAVPAGQAGKYVVTTTLSEGSVGTTVYRANDPANPSLGGLTQVGSNVEFANQNFPSVTWEAEEGQVYYIVVDRYAGARGRVVFNFQKVPANITFANATVIPSEGLEEVTYNFGAVREAGEPSTGFTPANAGHRSLWWTWTAPTSGRYQVDTLGSRLAVYEDGAIGAQFGNPTILGLDTILGVYTGSAVNSLSTVASNSRVAIYSGSNWSFQRNSRLEFNAVAGTTYHIMVNAHAMGMNEAEREQNTFQGEIYFRFKPVTPPDNDEFANATEITGTEYRTEVTNLGATKESGEPNHGGINGGRSLWWKWTAPESGPFIVSTAGNLFDDYNSRRTGIGVYTGSAVHALTTIGSNQNAAGLNTGDFTWSAVQFNAVAGTTYYFGVDAIFAGNLSFILTRPAPNDNFENATEMRGSRWIATGHNLLTKVEPGETKIESFFNPPTPSDANVRSVWWRWTAPVSGAITVDTLGSQVYNAMGVYTGSSLGALTPIATTPHTGSGVLNGEGPNRQRSSNQFVTFDAVAGTTYHITVQGAGFTVASSGPITLTLDGPPAVPFAPENFTAVRTGPSRIDLTWDDIAVDEEFYEIQRSFDGVSWLPLQETNPDVEAYVDFDTPEGTDYFYRIRAVNSVGQSAWASASVTIPQPPPAPANLQVAALSASDLRLTWDAPATAESQRVERSNGESDGPWTVLAVALPGKAESFTDTGLLPGTAYHYRLRASNTLGHSEWAAATGTTESAGDFTLSLPGEIDETAGSFAATIHRSATAGSRIAFLSSTDARLSVPSSVTFADGQSSAEFTVTVNDDAIENPGETGTITAFIPDALMGESFAGTTGSSVDAQNTGWGWNGAWYHGNSVHSLLVEPALSYTKNGTIGTPGSKAARLVQNADGGSEARRNFPAKLSSGSVWVSTLLYRNSTNWNTQFIVRENTGGGNWARVRYQNNTDHWELEAGTGNRATLLLANPYPETFYVVMEFDFTAREVRAWLNPDVSGTAPANAIGSATVPMQAALTGISRLDFGGWSNLDQFDEIRVATSFANLYGGTSVTRSIRIIDDESTTPAPDTRPGWWLDKFGVDTPEGFAAYDADPDGDGIPNFLEYALGGDPLVPGSVIMPSLGSVVIDEVEYLTFHITRNPNALEVNFTVETSTDLITWETGTDHIAIVSETPGELVIRSTAPHSTTPRRFIRLRVSD